MVYFKLNFVLFLNLLSVFKADLETVHFTNSPHKILKANNFTTYKVEVPNGDPITIIEANTALINKKLKFNEVETAKHHDQDNSNHVVDLKSSLSMTITPHNINDNDKYEKLAAGEEESVTNGYGNFSPEHSHQSHQHTMKTVYSPELLEKFLKDYANKVQSSEMPPLKPAVDDESQENMKDKYESIEAEGEEDENRRVSSTNVDQDGMELNDVQERKHYRPGSNYQHPYNKNTGWVTLEAVPWSKSKVSKWQSSVKPSFSSQSNYQSNGGNGGYRPNRPSNYEDDYSNNESDFNDYYQNKPSRPSFQNNQFHGGSSSSYNRPSEAPYSHHSAHHSSSFNNNYDENRPNRPYQPEIITDNRPSNFPNQHEPSQNNDYGYNRPYDKPNYEQTRPSFELIRPNSYENRPSSYDRPSRPQLDYHYSSGPSYNYANKDAAHPITYPGSGEGEWVLVSTTKGYQFPKRHGQRAMLFQAQNGVHGSDTKKHDNNGIITAASQQNEVSVRPPFHLANTHRPQHGPTKMTQQHVKLTVLPLFNKNENRPIQNQNNQYHQSGNNNMEVNVYKPSKYNGIIETEPSTQTIEESVAAAASANEANALAASTQKVTKKKKIRTRNYAVMRKNPGVNGDSTAVLAAVGAGLLPAAFGLIAPLALG